MLSQGQYLSSNTRVILQGGDGEGDHPPRVPAELEGSKGTKEDSPWRALLFC